VRQVTPTGATGKGQRENEIGAIGGIGATGEAATTSAIAAPTDTGVRLGATGDYGEGAHSE